MHLSLGALSPVVLILCLCTSVLLSGGAHPEVVSTLALIAFVTSILAAGWWLTGLGASEEDSSPSESSIVKWSRADKEQRGGKVIYNSDFIVIKDIEYSGMITICKS